MASKLNKRFILILTGIIVMLGIGIGGVAYIAISGDAERQVRMGKEDLAAGEAREALGRFARAIGKDPTNLEYFDLFEEALLQIVPESQSEASERYIQQYLGVLERRKAVSIDNPESWIRLLDALQARAALFQGGGEDVWESVQEQAERMISQFENNSSPAAEAAVARALGIQLFAMSKRRDLLKPREALLFDERIEALTSAGSKDPFVWEAVLREKFESAKRHARKGDMRLLERDLTGPKGFDGIIVAMEAAGAEPSINIYGLQVHRVLLDELPGMDDAKNSEAYAALLALGENATATIISAGPNDDIADELEVLRTVARTSALSFDDVYSLLGPVLDAKQLDLDLMFLVFQNAMQSNPELATKAAEQALAIDPLPVGLMSMLQTHAREEATIALFEAGYARRTDETNPTPIEELVALAERVKQEYAGNPSLGSVTLYCDGSIALAEENYAVARIKFTELSTHTFVQSASMQGRFVPRFVMASLGAGERGIAIAGLREFADRITEQQAIPLRLALATQLVQIGEIDDARIEVQRVVNADANHEEARELLDQINQLGVAMRAMPAGVDTFRSRVISSVRSALGEGRNEDALIVLRAAVEDKVDPPVEFLRMLVGVNVLLENDEEARRWAAEIPNVEDDLLIQRQMLILDIDEIVERTRAMVALDRTEPADQAALFFARIAATAGGPRDTTGSAADAVDPALDAALADLTSDSRLQLMLVVQVQKLDQANASMGSADPQLPKVMAVLEQANPDKVFLGNLKAQIALDSNDPTAAIAFLQPLKDSGLASADTEFLMGTAYQQAGRFGDSVESFAEAVRRAPDNSQMVLRYAGALERAGEQEKALALLRRSRQSPVLALALRGAWLDAESRFGDTAEALRNRMIIYASELDDSKAHEGVVINWGNALELSRLLLVVPPTFRDIVRENGEIGFSASAWAAMSGADRRAALSSERANRQRAAFQLLNDVEAAAKTDNERSIAKIARIYAELMANGKDAALESAEALLDCCSDSLAFGSRSQLARLLDEIGATEIAAVQFDILVETGEPGQLRGIISHINGVRYGDSLVAATRALAEATGSPQDQVLLADALIVTDELAEAGALIDRLAASDAIDSDARFAYDVVLLDCTRESRFARIKFAKLTELTTARGRGDVPSQEEAAIAAEVLAHALAGVRQGTKASEMRPDALVPFLRIHELHRIQAAVDSTEAIIADALVNAQRAYALAPASWATNRVLMQSHLIASDPKSAFQVVDRYLRQGGTHDESRLAIISTARMSNQLSQSLPALRIGMNNSPMEADWPGMIAAVMLESGDVENAAEMWWHVLEIDPSSTAIGRFVELEFRRQQPNMSRIAELSVQWPEAFAEHPELMAAQASVLAHSGETQAAARSFAGAYAQARQSIAQGGDPADLDLVLGHLLRVYPDQSLAEIETELSELAGGKMGAHEYAALANGALMTPSGQRDLESAKRYLRSASELAQDEPGFRMAMLHRLSTVLYISDDCDGAVRALEEVVSLGGTSAGTLNNLAYMLAVCRNDPQGAVAYAEHAVRLSPSSSSYLDTLGFIQLKLGRLEAAEVNLRNSLSIQASVGNLLHLAQLLHKTERSDQAEVLLQRLANEFPTLTPVQQNEVNALVSAIG